MDSPTTSFATDAPLELDHPPSSVAPQDDRLDTEARLVLGGMARGQTGKIPAELLVEHALEVAGEGDWPVQLGALKALLRRLDAAEREDLRLAARPPGRSPWGPYTTRRLRQHPRPYTTQLECLSPLRGSCDCRDFLRNGLGACKHLLAVVRYLAAREGRLQRALRAKRRPHPRWRLVWCPIRPLTGLGDWLAQVRLLPGTQPAERSAPTRRLLADWLCEADDGAWVPRETVPADAGRRLALVDALHAQLLPPGRASDAELAPDPALVALLTAERDELRRRIALEALRPRLERALEGLRRPLYPYQREGVEALWQRGRLLLADDMGLGKTVQAIAATHSLFGAGAAQRALLIVPASLKSQWLREWHLFSDVPATVVDGSPSERAALYRATRRGVLISNYAQVLRDVELMHDWDPDLVVLDEAQRIKNWATKTAGFVKRLRPRWRLVLTGTPLENRLDELSSILEWVDDRALEPRWRLGPWHTLAGDGERSGVVGARNLETIRQRIAPVFKRRLRREVLGQLPPRTNTTIPVAMTPGQRVAHDDLNQPIAQLAARANHRPLTRAEFLRLMSLLTTQRVIANGLGQLEFEARWPTLRDADPSPARLADLASPKLGELRELLTQLVVEQGRKVVVFSQWRRMLCLAEWATRDVLEAAGCRAVFFSGRESQRRRTQNVVDFHDDPATRVLFATDAGGVGLNLQRAATACINLELPWNPAVLEQRIARIHRLGQTQPIDVYDLFSEDSIEARIAGALLAKSALFKGLFDGESDEVRFDEAQGFLAKLKQLVPGASVVASEDEPAPDLGDDPDDDPDDDHLDPDLVDAELDAQVDAGDEAGPDASPAPARSQRSVASEPTAPEGLARPGPAPVEIEGLLASLTLRERPDGGVTIDAPPEAARTLAGLFEGMAQLLRSQG